MVYFTLSDRSYLSDFLIAKRCGSNQARGVARETELRCTCIVHVIANLKSKPRASIQKRIDFLSQDYPYYRLVYFCIKKLVHLMSSVQK